MARVRKPAIEAEVYETKTCKLKLPTELYALLDRYAKFASEMQGKSVDASGVVSGALRKIQSDQMFIDWMREQDRKERRHGTEAGATASE